MRKRSLNPKQKSQLGNAALPVHKRGKWNYESIQVCETLANHLLDSKNRKVQEKFGFRAGRPSEEILLSSDYIDAAVPLRAKLA